MGMNSIPGSMMPSMGGWGSVKEESIKNLQPSKAQQEELKLKAA